MRGGRTLEVMGISLSELGPWADKVRIAPELRSAENKLEYYRQSMHLARPGSDLAMAMAMPDPPEVDTYWRGTALVARLLKECLARGVVVHVDTPALELLSDDGHITGVEATHDGRGRGVPRPPRAHGHRRLRAQRGAQATLAQSTSRPHLRERGQRG